MLRQITLCFAFIATAYSQQLDTGRMAEVIDRAHAAGNFDGVVVVAQDGKVLLTKAVGDADHATKSQNTLHTVFRLASMTKQVTSLLVMQEVAAGHIALDQKAGELMKVLPPTTGTVTIRQLLNHTSGLANPSEGPEGVVPPFYLRRGVDAGDNTQAALGPCSATPKRAAGERFEYNNCDYLVLGAVLEAVTGKRYATLVRERAIEPLGLRSWGVFPGEVAKAPRVAKGYTKDGKDEDFENPATYGAAGALYGNALDVTKWDTALLTYKLLAAEATETMFRADPKLYGEALGSWSYDLPGTLPPVHLVERQGDIECTLLLNLLLPGRNASIVILANTERADLFNTYTKKGLGYDLVVAGTSTVK